MALTPFGAEVSNGGRGRSYSKGGWDVDPTYVQSYRDLAMDKLAVLGLRLSTQSTLREEPFCQAYYKYCTVLFDQI